MRGKVPASSRNHDQRITNRTLWARTPSGQQCGQIGSTDVKVGVEIETVASPDRTPQYQQRGEVEGICFTVTIDVGRAAATEAALAIVRDTVVVLVAAISGGNVAIIGNVIVVAVEGEWLGDFANVIQGVRVAIHDQRITIQDSWAWTPGC